MNSAIHLSHKNFHHTVLIVIHNVLNFIEFELERQHLIELLQDSENVQANFGATLKDSEG